MAAPKKEAMMNERYALQLLEEIRTILGSNLMVMSRLRDDILHYDDERTYKTSEQIVNEGVRRLEALREQLEGN
jgi:hypothetical protein